MDKKPKGIKPKSKSPKSKFIVLNSEQFKGLSTSKLGFSRDCSHSMRILKKIGAGFFGTAFRACNSKNCDLVLKHQRVKNQKQLDEVNKEIAILKRLKTSSVGPKILDHWVCSSGKKNSTSQFPQDSFIVLELFKNPVKWEDLSHQSLNKATVNLAKKLDFLHRKRIIHNDLHFGNVLVDKTGKIGIIDFGSSIDFSKNKPKKIPKSIPSKFSSRGPRTFLPAYDYVHFASDLARVGHDSSLMINELKSRQKKNKHKYRITVETFRLRDFIKKSSWPFGQTYKSN